MQLQPISQREAFRFIQLHHRHHKPPRGHLVSLALTDGQRIVGVAVIGRPVAKALQDGWTAEVTRVCTIDNAPMGAASKLYSKAKRAAQALGYTRVISYILATEDGVSLKAAGWKPRYRVRGASWSRPSRLRVDTHPLDDKVLWEAS